MSELASQFHISHFIISQARHASCSMRHSMRHFMQHTAYMPHMPCQSAPYGSTHRNHSATMTHCFTSAGQSAYWHLQRRRGRTHIASAFAMLSLRALHPPTHYSSLRTRLCVFFAARRGGCSSALFRTCVRGSSSTRSRKRCRMRCRHDVGATEGCAALRCMRRVSPQCRPSRPAFVCLFVSRFWFLRTTL